MMFLGNSGRPQWPIPSAAIILVCAHRVALCAWLQPLFPHAFMAASKTTSTTGAGGAGLPAWRGLLSAVLAGHFLIVAIAYAGLSDRSRLQLGFLSACRPYSQWMHLDPVADPPPFPYHWTDGSEFDTAYSVQWLPEGASEADDAAWRDLLPETTAGGPQRGREVLYARAWGYFVDFEAIPGKMALAAAQRLIALEERPARLRCRRRFLPPPDTMQPLDDPAYLTTIYEARVLLDTAPVRILKIDPDDETAATPKDQ